MEPEFNINELIVEGSYEGGAKAGKFARGGDPETSEPETTSPEDISKISSIIPDNIVECALYLDKRPGELCSSPEAVEAMEKMAPGPGDILSRAKTATNCDTERCVVSSGKFADVYGADRARAELARFFKVPGPTDISLLSNYNIDKTLIQWRAKFPDFFPYNFNMLDFKSKGDSLATVDLRAKYREGIRTAACVINSDYYSGRGKHWMALFVDMRGRAKWTVEFYNSSGNSPQAQFAEWMVDTVSTLKEVSGPTTVESVRVTSRIHQYSKTECGVYSLFYIWARLNGVSWSYFRDYKIPDEVMFEMRQHLFHDRNRPMMQTWNFDSWSQTTNVQWEPGHVRGADNPHIGPPKNAGRVQKSKD